MQGKISSDSHAPMIPKPPKARTQSTTRHQQLSQQLPLIPKCVCVCVYVHDFTWESRAAVQEARGPAWKG